VARDDPFTDLTFMLNPSEELFYYSLLDVDGLETSQG
jgi:hypothetical protein